MRYDEIIGLESIKKSYFREKFLKSLSKNSSETL